MSRSWSPWPARLAAQAGLLAGLWVLGSASAAPVYRCGNLYQDSPCPGAAAVGVADPRSPAQQAEAQARAERDRAAADALRQERLDREALPAAPARKARSSRAAAPAASSPAGGAEAADTACLPAAGGRPKAATSRHRGRLCPGTLVAPRPAEKPASAPTAALASPGKP